MSQSQTSSTDEDEDGHRARQRARRRRERIRRRKRSSSTGLLRPYIRPTPSRTVTYRNREDRHRFTHNPSTLRRAGRPDLDRSQTARALTTTFKDRRPQQSPVESSTEPLERPKSATLSKAMSLFTWTGLTGFGSRSDRKTPEFSVSKSAETLRQSRASRSGKELKRYNLPKGRDPTLKEEDDEHEPVFVMISGDDGVDGNQDSGGSNGSTPIHLSTPERSPTAGIRVMDYAAQSQGDTLKVTSAAVPTFNGHEMIDTEDPTDCPIDIASILNAVNGVHGTSARSSGSGDTDSIPPPPNPPVPPLNGTTLSKTLSVLDTFGSIPPPPPLPTSLPPPPHSQPSGQSKPQFPSKARKTTPDLPTDHDDGRRDPRSLGNSARFTFNRIPSKTLKKYRKKRPKNVNRDIIVSDDLRRGTRSAVSPTTRRLEKSAYDEVLEGSTTSDLTADRRFAFALIQPNRNWILSAESEPQCKQWVALFSKLVQGKAVHRGYLVKRGKNVKNWKKRYFVLFENKVLNYYHSLNIQDKGALIGDIDLRHTMWLRSCGDDEYALNVADYFGRSKTSKTSKTTDVSRNGRSKTILLRSQGRSKSGKNLLKSSGTKKSKKMQRKRGRRQKSATIVDPSEMMTTRTHKHFQSRSWGKRDQFGIESGDREYNEDHHHHHHRGNGNGSGFFLEIATPHRTWIFCAETESARNAWYSQIRDVFSDKLMLKIYFDSPCNVEILHNGQRLQDRYVALLKGWLILFRDKRTLNAIRRMTFFSDTIFRDYVRKRNCQTIPLRNADIVRNFKSEYGQWSFEVSIGDRCWYFAVGSLEILSQWLHLLTRRDDADFSHFEASYSNAPYSGAEEQYILSPNERTKKVGTEYNLNGLQEARETTLDDDDEDAVSDITDIDDIGTGDLENLEMDAKEESAAGDPQEVHSNPIAISSKHSRSRSKQKGQLNVGVMDQAAFTLVKPVAAPLPKLSWNSSSANSLNHGDGDSLQYSCNLHTSLEDIETPIQSMDECNFSLTREMKL